MGILKQSLTECLLLDKILNLSVLSFLSEKEHIILTEGAAVKMRCSEQGKPQKGAPSVQISKHTSGHGFLLALFFG